MADNSIVLKACSLFLGIKSLEISMLLTCLQAREKAYLKNEIVLLAGDKTSMIGVLLSGSVQIIKEDMLGRKNILAELTQGDLFAETFVCAGIEVSPVSVVAIKDTRVLWLNYQHIISSCPNSCAYHTKIIENMISVLARKNIFLNTKNTILSKHSIREKLLGYLTECRENFHSNSFTIPFGRTELADYLCVDRSALSRELGKMQAEGMLDYVKNDFTVHVK
ncbi:MAG: Crp/Fnr family transcriptional regulator [Clostridia bacterium]